MENEECIDYGGGVFYIECLFLQLTLCMSEQILIYFIVYTANTSL